MENIRKIIQEHFLNRILSVICIFFVLSFVVFVSKSGYSQYLAKTALINKSLADASNSISYDSTNPYSYKNRGVLFLADGEYKNAANDFVASLDLNPNDFLLWVRLGYSQYKLGEFEKAIDSYKKAISLSPNYAKPKRYLGRLYLHLGENKLAFSFLSDAANLDSDYLPEVLHLARRSFPNDPIAISNAINQDKKLSKKALAYYLIKHDMMTDESRKFLLSTELTDIEKGEFLDKIIAKNEIQFAQSIWKSKSSNIQSKDGNLMINGDFESEIDPNERHFGWVVNNLGSKFSLTADREKGISNSIGLNIKFEGYTEIEPPIVSQRVLVESGKNYQLNFAVRTDKLVSGGLPIVVVQDGNSGKIIESSRPLSNLDWETIQLKFSPNLQTDNVIISVRRKQCASNPCPIFGDLWLDEFRLQLK